jgi:hypothetical protein
MRSTNDAFDQDVKRVLHENQMEDIPLDYLEDIERRLDLLEKKKKRRILAWFFAGFVLAVGMTFVLLNESRLSKSAVNLVSAHGSLGKNKHSKTKFEGKKVHAFSCNFPTDGYIAMQGDMREKRSVAALNSVIKKEMKNDAITSIPFASTVNQVVEKQTPTDLNISPYDQIPAVISDFDSTHSALSVQDSMRSEESITALLIPERATKTDLPKWTRTIGFFTGLSGVISSFHTDDPAWLAAVGSNEQKYREIRSTQERSTSSIDLSLRYRMAKNHLVLQTGFDFFEWGEQVQYDYSFAYDGVNRYSYLSIPMYVGYRQSFPSFEWGANFGCSVGHVLQQKGQYIQPDLVTLALEHARTWSYTGMAQFEFIYILDRYRFSIVPTYRMSIGNVVNSTFTKNRYYSLGLQMGIAFQF